MDKKTALRIYDKVLLIRRFEEKAGQLYGMGKIGGFCHLYIGQEAVAVGVRESIENRDTVITSYRDHGAMLAQGSDPRLVMAELLGKRTGCSGGKGGSMHMFDASRGFYGGHGVVGAQVSIGSGIGFAHKYRDNGCISVVYLGDGAVNQGQLYESFNMASLWKLPVLYIIENNEYGMGTSVDRASANTNLYNRGESFGIPGYQADGMDIFEVMKYAKKGADHCRNGSGPFLIEFKTYRYRGHSMSDPATYRSKDEVSDYKDHRDPINLLKSYLVNKKITSSDELREVEKSAKSRVTEAVQFADESDFPSEVDLYKNLYHYVV